MLVHQPHLHRAVISVFFAAGSLYESQRDNGLSHLVEHMVFRGSDRYPTSRELNFAIEELGGTFEAATAPDATEFSVDLPEKTATEGIGILAELVTRPRFRDIEVERRIVAEEIREDLDEHGNLIDIDALSRRRLWPGHPLGRSVTGPLENALRFDADDLRRHLARLYVASNAVICASGSFDPDLALEAMVSSFAALPRGERPAAPPSPALGRGPSYLHVHKPGSQTRVRLAFHAPGLRDSDNTALEVLLRLLDDGMSTPLHRRVFEERGLAYSVGAAAEQYADAGSLDIEAACSHENVPELVAELLDTVRCIRDRETSSGALDKARRRAVWSLESYQDDPQAMNVHYGERELIQPARALHEEARALEDVKIEDVMRVAHRVLRRESLHATTVGSLDDDQRKAVERSVKGFE
ncbi:MAG: pitrilysin family protein [Polyangia bacterium]